MTKKISDRYYTVSQVAKVFSKNVRGVKANIKRGLFPGAEKFGTVWLIPKKEAEHFYTRTSRLVKAQYSKLKKTTKKIKNV